MPSERKRRTRSHVIADMSANHVERQVLLCGWSLDRVESDYGLDRILYTFDQRRYIQAGPIYLQLKATDRPQLTGDEPCICVRVEIAHLRHWLDEPNPVILVVHDAGRDVAHWMHVQAGAANVRMSLATHQGTTTLRVPLANRISEQSIRHFAGLRDQLLRRLQRSHLP